MEWEDPRHIEYHIALNHTPQQVEGEEPKEEYSQKVHIVHLQINKHFIKESI